MSGTTGTVPRRRRWVSRHMLLLLLEGRPAVTVRQHPLSEDWQPSGELEHEACGSVLTYCEEFDAFFCRACDEWTEQQCTSQGCPFCANRPEIPSDAHVPPERNPAL
jgi:hypothetical protein